MIIIHPLKLAYQPAPKLGTTSLFYWLFEILKKFEYINTNISTDRREWFYQQKNHIVENLDISKFDATNDYFKFCVIRDPVKRFISAYRNRVVAHGELDVTKKRVKSLMADGFKANPDINTLVENIKIYQNAVPTIRHHTLPMVDFIGRNPNIYTRIFYVDEMDQLRESIIQHCKQIGVGIDLESIPEIPRKQNAGPKLGINVLSNKSVDLLLDYYKEDYQTFPMLSIDSVMEEWAKQTADSTDAVQHLKQVENRSDDVVEATMRKPAVVDPASGLLDELTGVIVLRKDLSARGQLFLEDAHGTTLLNWRPSPKVALRHPDNPNAKHARFKANNVRINPNKPVQILWREGTDKKMHVVFAISAASEPT